MAVIVRGFRSIARNMVRLKLDGLGVNMSFSFDNILIHNHYIDHKEACLQVIDF
jgi:hypothetical protein